MVLAGDLVPAGTTLVTPEVKFLVWESTTCKELQPLEQASYLQILPITAPLGDCTKNVISELTIRHKPIEMHVKGAIATKQYVTLWAN